MKILSRFSRTVVGAALLLSGGIAGASGEPGTLTGHSDPQEWNFQVFLNDDPIGFHNFRLNPLENGYELQTEAEFKVKVLFVTAYQYQHENVETWRNGCLERIEARTNDNGDQLEVVGRRDTRGFDLAATGSSDSLDSDCVRTFAYWDLAALRDTRLLNSQTGAYQPVDVDLVGRESIEISGRQVAADRYSLEAEGLDLDLWYSPEGEWLALTSTVEKGRQLRYKLVRT
ncbi:MAG: hypothetical protein EHM62_04805 [Methylococcus sp.]|nr:MAG: hypothetical protein EHM62_04805 [Methylococcus sp.]